MIFSGLLDIKYDVDSNVIDVETLIDLLPNTPLAVIRQVYSDHGRNVNFQRQFANMEIGRLAWALVDLRADAILQCEVYEKHQRWFNQVADRVDGFNSKGWKCIDSRTPVQEHWAFHGTWIEPPVFLAAGTDSPNSLIRLVEGHTRVGLLGGLVRHNVISRSENHKIWLGKPGTNTSAQSIGSDH